MFQYNKLIEPSRSRGLLYRAELSFAPPAFSHHALRAVYQPLELTKPAIRFQSPLELERSGFAAQLCPLALENEGGYMSDQTSEQKDQPTCSTVSFPREIRRFVFQIESLSKALEPTMTILVKNFKKYSEDLDKHIKTHGVEKKDRDKKTYFQIKSEHIPKLEKLRKEQMSAALAIRNIPITFMVSLVSHYDAYLGDLLRCLFYTKPEILNASKKELTFEDLVSFSSIEEARHSIIEKEINSVIRESHTKHFDWMEERFAIPLRKDLPIWSSFIELTERRNLFVHCNGVVSLQYLDVCKKHAFVFEDQIKVGDKLDVNQEYFEKAFNCIFEIGVKLGHVLWRKYLPDEREKADNELIAACFDLLVDENFVLSKILCNFAANTLKNHHSDELRRISIINLAIAHKNLNDEEGCINVLKQEDWSACNSEFKLAVAVLKDQYDDATNIMKDIGSKGRISKEQYATWPLFSKFRYSEEFLTSYKKIFRKEFTIDEIPAEMSNKKLTNGYT